MLQQNDPTDGGSYPAGSAIRPDTDGTFVAAIGAGVLTQSATVYGLTEIDSVIGQMNVPIATAGPFVLTEAQWALVTDEATSLDPGPYYLSPTNPGKITRTRPSGVGQFETRVGIALTSTLMVLGPQNPVAH